MFKINKEKLEKNIYIKIDKIKNKINILNIEISKLFDQLPYVYIITRTSKTGGVWYYIGGDIMFTVEQEKAHRFKDYKLAQFCFDVLYRQERKVNYFEYKIVKIEK